MNHVSRQEQRSLSGTDPMQGSMMLKVGRWGVNETQSPFLELGAGPGLNISRTRGWEGTTHFRFHAPLSLPGIKARGVVSLWYLASLLNLRASSPKALPRGCWSESHAMWSILSTRFGLLEEVLGGSAGHKE